MIQILGNMPRFPMSNLASMTTAATMATALLVSSPALADPDIRALFLEYQQKAMQQEQTQTSSSQADTATAVIDTTKYNSMLESSPLTQQKAAPTKAMTLEQYFNQLKSKALSQNTKAATAPAPAPTDQSTAHTLLSPSNQNPIQDPTKLHELLNELDSYITDNGLAYAPVRSMFPGRIMDSQEAMQSMLKASQDGAPGETNFYYPWRYREQTYEMHFAHAADLASCIYALAIFTKDISPNVPYDKFIRGVSGFHYSVEQICDWLNNIKSTDQIRENELAFVALLLHDQVIVFDDASKLFKAQGKVAHVLAASASKKRTILTNLRHERLHVFWDLDPDFQAQYIKQAQQMSPEEQKQAFKHLINYNQENVPQLIEEWAIGQAEKQPLKQKSQS
ncbi:MAG TPA: hypothetical protein H9850_05440 [Candidatus Anaerobiospirillum pullistercoris]|uniref:Secreted protein n=1 Tax=Candidatus Anaerobiospirillum pullistercoris TaxID=2838452 RepID=A0A9D1WEQ2_9GAMM|nr:hypothetical protein [Candidatus Anaerobiospirillum pullistercoris]